MFPNMPWATAYTTAPRRRERTLGVGGLCLRCTLYNNIFPDPLDPSLHQFLLQSYYTHHVKDTKLPLLLELVWRYGL